MNARKYAGNFYALNGEKHIIMCLKVGNFTSCLDHHCAHEDAKKRHKMSPKCTLANEKMHKQEEMAHFSIGSACTLNYSECTAIRYEELNTIISACHVIK